MDPSDMLDVIHYFFDEDVRYTSIDEARLHSVVRNTIFGDLYETPYKYGISTDSDASYSETDGVKPFIPPTDIDPESSNPFGDILDSPL